MAKDNEEKIGAMSQKNCHGLKYKYPLKNYRVHEMPTGDQLPPHYYSKLTTNMKNIISQYTVTIQGGPKTMQHLRSIISKKLGKELKSCVHYRV